MVNLAGNVVINVSNANTKLLAELDLPRPESVKVKVEGADMQMWVLKPPGFDPNKKWPLAYLVHGGPQGAWEDGWSYRWNPELWAAQGYVVAMPNPRGSTGFGQKFVDEISGDWGGKCFNDLMKGVEYMESQPYIDKERMAAAGASFGGYMMNWFQGHTTKFKTLICHCGVFNFDSMYATTDELWFDEWEHGGPPWGKNRESYDKFSPHKKAANFKTPMLIIHNDLDFRVPVSEGQQLFTTLQRLKIPAKFINFPDEGHWVLKPKNSEFWHKEVFAWLAKYVPPGLGEPLLPSPAAAWRGSGVRYCDVQPLTPLPLSPGGGFRGGGGIRQRKQTDLSHKMTEASIYFEPSHKGETHATNLAESRRRHAAGRGAGRHHEPTGRRVAVRRQLEGHRRYQWQ